jgi:hypothetical protein
VDQISEIEVDPAERGNNYLGANAPLFRDVVISKDCQKKEVGSESSHFKTSGFGRGVYFGG